MSDRGEDLKRQGWNSSRSSSGEGPDEVAANDETNVNQTQSQFNLESSSPNPITTTLGDLESDESRKLVAEADDLNSKLRELNIGSFDGGNSDG